MTDPGTVDVLLWVVVPYVSLVVLVLGTAWRYRHDRFGGTTRSAQLDESSVLRWGGLMFHVGVLLVVIGHVGGLLVPQAWTEAAGISEDAHHLMAVLVGALAGMFTLVGMAVLIARRRRLTGPVFATTRNDRAMYVVLAAVIVLGLWATVRANVSGDGYDYRDTVSPWFRSLFVLQPDPVVMAGVPRSFQIHVVAAFALVAVWPFTGLIDAFSASVGYLTGSSRRTGGAPGGGPGGGGRQLPS